MIADPLGLSQKGTSPNEGIQDRGVPAEAARNSKRRVPALLPEQGHAQQHWGEHPGCDNDDAVPEVIHGPSITQVYYDSTTTSAANWSARFRILHPQD